MFGYCSLPADVSEERNSPLSPIPPKTPSPPVPIPRDGCKGGTSLLHILILLATILVGTSFCAVQPTFVGNAQIAEIFSSVCIILLVVYLWRVTRGGRGILILTIVVGFFLYGRTGSLLPAGLFCGILFSISQGALLLAVQPKEKLPFFPLVPVLAYAAVTLLSMDPLGAMAALIPYPPMIVLALATRASAEKEDGPTRTGVICTTSVALGVSLGGMILLSLIRHYGTSNLSVILEHARQAVMDYTLSLDLSDVLTSEQLEIMQELLSYENVKNAVNSLFNLLPALFAIAVMIPAAGCQSFLFSSLKAFGYGDSVTPQVKAFRMSTISCVVFLVAYAAVWLDNAVVSSLAGTIAQNIYLLLLPGLALAGTSRATSSLARKGSRGMGCLFYLIILIPCLLVIAPIIPAMLEVIGNLFNAITAKLKSSEDDDPFGPSGGNS